MKERSYRIIKTVPEAEGAYRIELSCSDSTFFDEAEPGRFLHIRVPDASLALRRPISLCDVSNGVITLIVAVRGEGTKALCAAKPGTVLIATGPAGSGFPMSRVAEARLLGGGIGVAPLVFAARALAESGAKVTAYLGFRSADNAVCIKDFEKLGCGVRLFTDDGSAGAKGFAADALIADDGDSPVFACGPKPMFKALQNGLKPGTPCFASMEERMGCGVGACLVCACAIREKDGIHNRRVCVDGPVFPLSEVVL